MIIFGTRGVNSTVSQGQFLCPQCETEQHYKHKKVTRFFTLYFIPIIPLGRMGEFVECQSCRGTYVPRVLEYNSASNKNEFQSQYEKAIRHSLILMMMADGQIDDDEMVMVQKIINHYGHNDITIEELEDLIVEVKYDNESIDTYLSKIAPSLNEHGKESILKSGIAVALADGTMDDSEYALIQQMANAMEMSSSHVKGILSEIMHSDSSFSSN